MIGQLRPARDSFYTFVFSGITRFDALILCEGRMDAEVLKELARKLDVCTSKSIAVTDCEGIDKLYDVAAAVALLLRISRKLRIIALVVDADELSPHERADSLANSLASRGLRVTGVEEEDKQLFSLNIRSAAARVYVAVSAVEEYDFERHMLEDHVLKLLELEGRIERGELKGAATAKEALARAGFDTLKVLRVASRRRAVEAFSHMTGLLKLIARDPPE